MPLTQLNHNLNNKTMELLDSWINGNRKFVWQTLASTYSRSKSQIILARMMMFADDDTQVDLVHYFQEKL